MFMRRRVGLSPKKMRFEEADANGDGRLERSEASNAMIKAIFECYDVDGNGRVTAEEWGKWHEDAFLFQKLDANSDGVLTLEEVQTHARKHGTFDKLFDFADVDKDGFISRKEAASFSERYYKDIR